MDMELRQLRSFSAVAALEHFRQAAETLNIAQPALSQQIKQLEEELGLPLFERVGRGVRLTEAGSLFWDYADRILALAEESTQAVRELAGLARGTLRLGIVQTANSFHAPAVLRAFQQAHPKVFLSVSELAAADLETRLVKGELDLGVTFCPADSELLVTEPLYEENFSLIVGPEHPLANRRSIELAALRDTPLALLSRDYCTRRLFEKTCEELNVDLLVSVEMNTIEGILNSLRETQLATVLPSEAGRSPLATATLRAIPLAKPGIRRRVGLVYRNSGYLTPAARAMAEIWRAA